MAADTLPVTRWVLRDQRRSLVLWAIAIMAVSTMYMAFYPSMANEDMEALMAGLPEALTAGMGWDAIATGAGYLDSTVYGLLAPALLLVFGISTGARLIAGEEESGTLELESTAPASRRAIALQRFGALALDLALLCGALGLAALVLVPVFDMDVAAGNVVAATFGLWLFVLAMAAIAFAVGAATGRRGLALACGAAVAVLAYIANAIAPMVEGAGWLEAISPFAWYNAGDPLTEGVDPVGFTALAVLVGVVLVLGVLRFDRRDLSG